MANITITNNDNGSVLLHAAAFSDELLTLGAATVKAGTILARDSVSAMLVPYVIGGSTNQNGIPRAVLTYQLVTPGSGNHAVRVCIAGQVDQNRLVIHSVGDASTITAAVRDLLRDACLIPIDVQQIGRVDNPQPEIDS